MKETSAVKTIDRLVQVLNCFSLERPSWSLAELSEQLDLPRSTLHRFLVSLQLHGILRRDAGKRWRMGYRLFIWGSLAVESTGLRHIARPIMEELVVTSGETVILTVYQGYDVVCIEKAETSQSVRLALGVGAHHPPHAGASSKVLTAYLPTDQIHALIAEKGLPKLCANTITDPDELLAELARIRQLGYAESYEETDPDAWGVATPIRDWRGEVVAAIGVAGPSTRHSQETVRRCVALCRDAAQRISSLLSTGVER